jgi:hypothetical protein
MHCLQIMICFSATVATTLHMTQDHALQDRLFLLMQGAQQTQQQLLTRQHYCLQQPTSHKTTSNPTQAQLEAACQPDPCAQQQAPGVHSWQLSDSDHHMQSLKTLLKPP